MTELDLLALGGLIADLLIPVPRLPISAGDHQMAYELLLEAGGVANTLIIASRLGLRTGVTGYLGEDDYGQTVRRKLDAEGIDSRGVILPVGSTSDVSMVLVDDAGQHVFLGAIGTAPGGRLPPDWREHIPRTRAIFVIGWLLAQAADPQELLEAVALARAHGCQVFFDPGPVRAEPQLMASLLHQSTTVMLTEDEARQQLGTTDPHHALDHLIEWGLELAAIKLGAQGCLLATPTTRLHTPAFPIQARDTVGAGDAFNGALIYGVLQGWPLDAIARMANAAGAATAARLGTGALLPSRADILALFSPSE